MVSYPGGLGRRSFVGALIVGLVAGAVTAAISLALFLLAAVVFSWRAPSLDFAVLLFGPFFAGVLALNGAALIAVFPAGPIWALFAWVLHLRRVSPWVYGIGGATAALWTFVLLLLMFGSYRTPDSVFGTLVFAAWFAAAGAVGGYVTGRAMPRAAG
jgi:hypothetical protein